VDIVGDHPAHLSGQGTQVWTATTAKDTALYLLVLWREGKTEATPSTREEKHDKSLVCRLLQQGCLRRPQPALSP
jgi:hypothetical protein